MADKGKGSNRRKKTLTSAQRLQLQKQAQAAAASQAASKKTSGTINQPTIGGQAVKTGDEYVPLSIQVAKSGEDLRRRQKKGIAWFEKKVKDFIKPGDAQYSHYQSQQKPFIGGMFFYIYDAKWKDKLEYWDALPLVIPIFFYDNGFLGLNLHYLDIQLRIKLLNKLMEFARTKNKRKYMELSYGLLKTLSQFDLVKPTIHRYLFDHLKTRLVKVNFESWEDAAYLPVQDFRKASASKVWADSRRIYKGGKR